VYEREYTTRRKRYRQLMIREGAGGLLVSNPADVRYLCGFTGSSAMALLLENAGYLVTDFRYKEQAALEVIGLRVIIRASGFGEVLSRLLKGRRGVKLAFDTESLSYAQVVDLRAALKGRARLTPLRSPLGLLRASKSRSELDTIKNAIRLAQKAFQEAVSVCGEGKRERDLALALDTAARRGGAEGRPFDTIVAGGPRGAMAHARPGGRRLRGFTVVDWGVVYKGYCTDMTRTLAFGKVDSRLRKAHGLVLEAQRRALEKIKPGARAREVDRAAREVIEEAGYGDFFGHGLGHGVGLEVHERPWISGESRDRLEEGMVFTLEPGIYLPGRGGVRVEDMVLVTLRGAELLTTLPRGLDPAEYLV